MRDEDYLNRAFQLAARGCFTTTPNPNVGCVLVRDGEIIGEGWHECAGQTHAEIMALNIAGAKAQGATAYVTLEPCSHHGKTPPCVDALIAAGISRVVYPFSDPNPQVSGRGFHRLMAEGIAITQGLMIEEAEALNRGFFKRMRTGFPFVQVKLAASLDGRTAMANGESQWITGPDARQDVQRLRAQSCAILTGSNTVLIDNPLLTVRWNELDKATQSNYPQEKLRQPLRIIIDSKNQITPLHRLIHQPGKICLARIHPDDKLWPENVEQFIVPSLNAKIDLVSLMMLLGKREINHVWVEAGATLAGVLIQAGLVDELIVYVAPKLLGNDAKGLCLLPGLKKLIDAPSFIFKDVQPVGKDVRLTLIPKI